MEGRTPFRIYDPGGVEAMTWNSLQQNNASYQQLLAENSVLKERMKGLQSLGNLLEESQTEALRLRQKVEELVRDSEDLRSSPGLLLAELLCVVCLSFTCSLHSQETSSEFEIVNMEEKMERSEGERELAGEDGDVSGYLNRLGSSLSVFAEETNRKQLLAHLSRMAVDFSRLTAKVQRNESKTSVLQTLCEQLRSENEDLRRKLDNDIQHQSRVVERIQYVLTLAYTHSPSRHSQPRGPGAGGGRKELEILEKKAQALEQQRRELLEVNKQWDQQFRTMKQQYEQKIVELRQRLSVSQRSLSGQEADRDVRQRDFDKQLLLAKTRISSGESEVKELKQKNKCLQDQLMSLTKQREYQEREIQRLNKALENVLTAQTPLFVAGETGVGAQRQELLTQLEVLKHQVKIFQEDFQRERSDRERMNEEKEVLKLQLEQLQSQNGLLNTQDPAERRSSEPSARAPTPFCPGYPVPPYPPLPQVHGGYDWQIHYPPTALGLGPVPYHLVNTRTHTQTHPVCCCVPLYG
uniref:TNFAIP3 interacting protein 1 n=1 Tax=Callorhinchus milii TaxID=7868 RepID=A0A4W3HGU7_CALMI